MALVGAWGAEERVTVVGTHDLCVRCVKARRVPVALTGTDAQIVRPYSRYTSGCVQRVTRSCAPTFRYSIIKS